MYQFINEAPLETLKCSGEDDCLKFSSPYEEVTVYISERGTIARVDYHDTLLGQEKSIQEQDAHSIVVGSGNTERNVYHFLKPNEHKHRHMRLGLTVHAGDGTWSSLPHDFENNPEPGFEEVFFYLLSDGPQKAFQVGRGMWMNGAPVDDVWPVHDRCFGVVPMGYHPVVGEPGVNVSYIWVYLAKYLRWEKI